MIITLELLAEYRANFYKMQKNDFIFNEEDEPAFYFQLISGEVKMSSFSENGQEFIQGVFKPGESFGEPALFGGFRYPNNAIATETSKIAKLPKDIFFELLKENYEIHKKFNAMLSNRLRYKAILLKEISSYYPEHVILTLLKYLRENSDSEVDKPYCVPYTRQQIADMTGLRVETVIRAVKKLDENGKLEIRDHKIYIK